MTREATKARAAAVHFEAKKTGFGQAQDGWSLTLRVQHGDMPPHVRDAMKGTRYMVALVEIDDNEEPKEVMPSGRNTPTSETAPAAVAAPAPLRARKPVAAEKRLAQQAGICCADPIFHAYLFEHDMMPERTEECATTAVRMICGVQSRAEIVPGSAAGNEWEKLHGQFLAWKLAG